MYTENHKKLIQTIIKAAYEKRLLELRYCSFSKGAGKTRLVEPYCITETNGATMLRAYQTAAEPGWRFFNTAMIVDVRDTGQAFESRRPAVILVGDEKKHIGPVESKDVEQIEYEKLLLGAIADLQVDDTEIKKLAKFREEYGLTAQEIRGVHYKVFADCLNAVTKDKLVSDEGRKLLIDLNHCLHACGAGLIE